MAKLPLPQGVGKTVRGGWGCLFIGMHLALKGWMQRKWLVLILVGHGGAADTWCWGCHALGARARQVHLTADLGEQICSPNAWGCCLLCQKLQVAWF
jgi:hypothetical protein